MFEWSWSRSFQPAVTVDRSNRCLEVSEEVDDHFRLGWGPHSIRAQANSGKVKVVSSVDTLYLVVFRTVVSFKMDLGESPRGCRLPLQGMERVIVQYIQASAVFKEPNRVRSGGAAGCFTLMEDKPSGRSLT